MDICKVHQLKRELITIPAWLETGLKGPVALDGIIFMTVGDWVFIVGGLGLILGARSSVRLLFAFGAMKILAPLGS